MSANFPMTFALCALMVGSPALERSHWSVSLELQLPTFDMLICSREMIIHGLTRETTGHDAKWPSSQASNNLASVDQPQRSGFPYLCSTTTEQDSNRVTCVTTLLVVYYEVTSQLEWFTRATVSFGNFSSSSVYMNKEWDNIQQIADT
jgi:hypothetical protein